MEHLEDAPDGVRHLLTIWGHGWKDGIDRRGQRDGLEILPTPEPQLRSARPARTLKDHPGAIRQNGKGPETAELRRDERKTRHGCRRVGAQRRRAEADQEQRCETPTETRDQLPFPRRPNRPGDDLAVPKSRIAQGPREVLGRREPVGRQLLQRTPNGRVHVRRNRSPLSRRLDRRAGDNLPEHRLRCVAQIRRLAHQHLEKHTAQRVDVARPAHGLVTSGLLGAHVERRANAQAGLGQPRAPRRPHREGDPEVGHDGLAVLHEDVGRLDVTVDHAVPVRMVECVGHARRDANCLFDRQLLVLVEALGEGLAFHVRHHVEEEAVRLPGIEERKDVGVLKVGGDLYLGEETLGPDHGGQLGLEDLQRDVPLVLQVLGQVDRGHPALAELALDDVAAFECRVQLGGEVCHRLQDVAEAERTTRMLMWQLVPVRRRALFQAAGPLSGLGSTLRPRSTLRAPSPPSCSRPTSDASSRSDIDG